MTTWEKNRLPGSALRVEAIGRATRIALALVLFAAAPRAQNLSGALTSGTFSTATNCAATNPPSGCVSATLTQGTNVSIQAGQTVLGPGFDAKASNTSTSLVIGPFPPAITSVTPASGSGATQPFTVAASSGDWAGQGTVQFLANWTVDGYKACYAIYYQSSNSMYLLNDNGSQWLGGSAPGTASATVSNSQCTLNIQNSSTSLSGNNLSVTFAVTFNSSFIGPQQVFALTSDASGQNSGWQDEGIWTGYPAPSSQPPCTPAASCTVTPTGQTGMSAAFTFTSSDLNGAAYMPQEFLVLGSYSANSCVVLAYHESNAAYLLSDDGSAWNPIPAGGSLSNSQCAVSGTSGSNSGNNWIYSLTATFAAGYGGARPVYMQVWDHGLQTSGMLQVGTWTVGTPESITVASNPPGLSIAADGVTYPSPQSFTWAAGSQHTLSVSSPQRSGTQYFFTGWSDGATAASRTITVPSSAASYTAAFAGADFTISAALASNSPTFAMAGGNGATYDVSVTPNAYFSDSVTVSANLPPGFTAKFSNGSSTITLPTSSGWQSTMYIVAPAGVTGNISASATGTDSATGLTHSATGGVLPIEDFALTYSPSWSGTGSDLVVAKNTTGAWALNLQGLNGFNQTVNLAETSYLQPPNGPAECPNQAFFVSSGQTIYSAQPGQSIQAQTLAPNPADQNSHWCGVALSASYGGVVHSITPTLIYTPSPDFTLLPVARQTTAAGGAAAFTMSYSPIGNFNSSIGFAVVGGMPAGLTSTPATFGAGQTSGTLTVSVAAGVPGGTYQLTVTATSPAGCTETCAVHTEFLWLTVGAGGTTFSVSATPISKQPIAASGSATYAVTVTGQYNGVVQLSAAGGPPGTSISLSTANAQPGGPSATLTVAVPASVTPGSYALTVTAAANSVVAHASADVTVAPASPASIVSPAPGAIVQGGAITFVWSTGAGPAQFSLALGSSPGASDYYAGAPTTLQSATVNLPALTAPAAVYATLSSLVAGAWQSVTYAYRVAPLPSANPNTLQAHELVPSGYYLYNNGISQTWSFCVTTDCVENGADAGYLQSCQVYQPGASQPDSNVSAQVTAIPSLDDPLNSVTFDVAFTATTVAAPGARTMVCAVQIPGYSPFTIALSNAITVYDATPVISAVIQEPPAADGSFYAEIYGTNFGSVSGVVSVCASGATPCTSSDVSTSQGPYSYWSDNQINVLLIPSPTSVGTYDLQLSTLGEGGQQFVAGPQQGSTSQSNRGQVNINPAGATVEITNADVAANVIKVQLSGQSNASGMLTVTAQGDSNVTVASQVAGPGAYAFSFQRPNLAPGQYNSIQAVWSLPNAAPQSTKALTFKALGSTRFSTYNVPFESKCAGGSQQTAYIITSVTNVCNYYTTALNSVFMQQTAIDGTGSSNSNGLLKAFLAINSCEYPQGGNSGNTFYQVPSIVGSCNTPLVGGTSLATYPTPRTANQTAWKCGDSVVLFNNSDQTDSTKTVQDGCPLCSGQFHGANGHIDTYSSSQACNVPAFVDYGVFNAIRLR